MTQHNELTPDEVSSLRDLNKKLAILEQQIKDEMISINKTMKKRIQGKDQFLHDNEIECNVSFYLREDDTDWDDGSDNIIFKIDSLVHLNQLQRWDHRIADGKDHNLTIHVTPYFPDKKVCYLSYYLFHRSILTLKDLLRIGEVHTDIQVLHQNCLKV
jgi:hypothetical protein